MTSLTEKLIHVQKELKSPKGQYNSFGKYKYRSAEDILESVKPLNAEQGLLLTLTDEPVFIGNWHYIKAVAEITDGEQTHTVTAYARESENKKGMDHSQVTGTASSYARKYALNGLYLIDDTKDADTNEYQEQNNTQSNKASDKQLNLVNSLIKSTAKKYDMADQQLYEGVKKRLGIEVDMENWTSQQASAFIKEVKKGDQS
ncbi:ERF family protein [Virgibacillus sp. FSP13]